MAESKIVPQSRFVSGLSDFPKEGLDPYVYYDGVSIDHRHDPRAITLLPQTLKESGSTVKDLVKWGAVIPTNLTTYMYGDTGNIYSRTTTPTYTLLHQAPSSHGNGLFYYLEDDYVYYTSDNSIGRYGPITLGSPQFVDNYFQAQGGVPTNTNSLQLVASSSQYASHADAAAFDITGNIAIGAYIYPNSLPTVGNSMTLVSKWDESTNHRSYKFGLGAVSGYFGNGTDGSLTISSNTTEAPIDSACTGTAGTQVLTATNASFASGQVILIHQTQGTNAGQWERNIIQGYTAGTITLTSVLMGTYTTGAQVRVLKQYTNVTINSGVTYTAKAWNGTVGGILGFLASGTVTGPGNISANGTGFRGGSGVGGSTNGIQGEGKTGTGTTSTSANGMGGGGGSVGNAGGGGGGYATIGGNGNNQGGTGGTGGGTSGSTDLTTMLFGGGGGSGCNNQPGGGTSGAGGNGGGIIFINAVTLTVTGNITSTGAVGGSASGGDGTAGGGGGGAAGSVLMKVQTTTLGTNLVTASGGTGGNAGPGGTGGNGRLNINYLTSYTGTTSPTINAIQDNTLVTNVTYQLQFAVSSDGSTSETLTQNINLQTGKWQEVAVSWVASTSVATFYLNAVSQGTATGTKTSISNNASLFYVGTDKAAAVGDFYDGLIDDVVLFNTTQDSTFWTTMLSQQIATNTPNLQAYYRLNNDLTDSTASANGLTGTNTPTFSTNVPYPGATTRLDIDQTQVGTGQTYTLATTISEASTSKISFTPTRDPQKSILVNIAAVGTGNWTVTVHDSLNNVVSSLTVANALLHTGDYEFIFATPWRTLTNFTNTYHVHITSTVADGTVTTGTASNLSTAGFTTYFSFLVTDTAWHPIGQMLNQMVIGNERYVATYNGLAASYDPNTLVLPAGYRVRCFANWNEYLAIGVMRGSSITDFDQGRIYFWDGSALTFNFYIDVPEGGVNALLSRGASLYAWCGYTGYLFQYQTGLEGDKVKRISHILESDTVEIYPGAVTTWRTLVRFGVAGSSTSTSINRGVYSWGSFLTMGFFQQLYRESLSFDYPISTGNYGSTVNIGLTLPIQNQLLIGWKDGLAYGVDNVSFSNVPARNGSIKLLLSDDGEAYKQKAGLTLVAQHLPLLSGESIQVEASTDRGAYQLSGYNSTVGSTKTSIVIPGSLYNEYQVGADLASTVSTSPTITSIDFERDPQTGALKLQTM